MSPVPYAVMSPVERLLAVCRAEIGYHEKASNRDLDSKTDNSGTANYTKYAWYMDLIGDVYNGRKNGYDWCDVWVDSMFIMTFGEALGVKLLCQPYKGCGAGCNWSAGYYKANGQFYKTGPQPGDQIFYDWDLDDCADHTGIVTAVRGGYVYTIEGNTSDPSNPGDVVVAEKCRPLNAKYIYGFGRPDWSLVESTKLSGWTGYVTNTGGDGLNCRTFPVSGAVLDTFRDGDTLTIIQTLNDWALVEGRGWVSMEYVSKTAPEPTPTPTPGGDDDMKYYQKLADVPKSYRAAVQKVMERGALKGSADPDPSRLDDNTINISEDMCRTMVILDRLGLLK